MIDKIMFQMVEADASITEREFLEITKEIFNLVKTGYNTIEEAYKDLMPTLISYARRHLYNTDYAVDAAHSAFEKTLSYLNKNKKSKVSSFIILQELKRACRRLNKNSNEITFADLDKPIVYDEEN